MNSIEDEAKRLYAEIDRIAASGWTGQSIPWNRLDEATRDVWRDQARAAIVKAADP